MTVVDGAEVRDARDRVTALRGSPDPGALAEALETLATAAIEDGDLGTAASALEEAAGVWGAATPSRCGHCLLLAAATRRLSGDLGAARHDLERASATPDLPDSIRGALDMERAEQELADGDAVAAHHRLGAVLDALIPGEDGLVRAHVLQRRAAAAVAVEAWGDAAADLMDAEALLRAHGRLTEAESAALGAAVAYAHVEPDVGEQVWAAATAAVPADGAVRAQRGIVGGQVALLAGDAPLALRRFDAARQGALDAADPVAYLMAASEAVRAAEALGDDVAAYARLAGAWVSVADLLGAESGRQLVRPLLEQLRARVGPERFDAARAVYEAGRRSGDAGAAERRDAP